MPGAARWVTCMSTCFALYYYRFYHVSSSLSKLTVGLTCEARYTFWDRIGDPITRQPDARLSGRSTPLDTHLAFALAQSPVGLHCVLKSADFAKKLDAHRVGRANDADLSHKASHHLLVRLRQDAHAPTESLLAACLCAAHTIWGRSARLFRIVRLVLASPGSFPAGSRRPCR